jgi:hypothetical protein
MSMKGDFPGLSNFAPGTIGSCQYKIRFPVDGSTSPAFSVEGPALADGPAHTEGAAGRGALARPRSHPASNAA